MSNTTSLTFEAFADPTRREILTLLAGQELSVSQIAEAIDHVGRTTVSSHLRVLRAADLVSERREGRFRYYSVNESSASDIVGFLQRVYSSKLEGLSASTDTHRSASRRKVRDTA